MKNEKTNTKIVKILLINIIIIIGIGLITFDSIKKSDKIIFQKTDGAYFLMLANTAEPEEIKIRSVDAYYLRDTGKIYYNAKYSLYVELESRWADIDEVAYGRKGKMDGMYCLNWDSIAGFEEEDKEFKRALTEGVHKSYTTDEIQELLEEAYIRREE